MVGAREGREKKSQEEEERRLMAYDESLVEKHIMCHTEVPSRYEIVN